MHMLIEIWSAKPAWYALPVAARQAFVDSVLKDVAPLMQAGLRVCGSGFACNDLPNSLPCQYFAVWEAPDAALVATFARTIRDAGWFDYFDQLNIGGAFAVLDDVLSHQISGAH